MPLPRVLCGVFLLTWVQPALAVEFWDAQQCAETMLDHVEHLEEDVSDIKELRELLADAQRKGDALNVANFERVLESKRVDGIQSMLKRIDTVEYVYCDKSLFDPSLIARVDAVRPWAEGSEPILEAEAAPGLEIVGIASTFVPYETVSDGGCTGPYIDLAIKVVNHGGTFPRPVDLEVRKEKFPTVADSWSYLLLVLEFDYGPGGRGQQQVEVFARDIPGGVIPTGGAITIPMRVAIFDNRTSAAITTRMTGASLPVAGESLTAAVYTTNVEIPIWDLYTVHTNTVSGSSPGDRDIPLTGVVASIINRGKSPTPGPVMGTFTVRHTEDGPSIISVEGKTAWPVEGTVLLPAGKNVAIKVDSPIVVSSNLIALCPDGSYGKLADGNLDDNKRVLHER